MCTCECLHVCVHHVGACYPRSLVPEETGVPCKWNLQVVVSCLTQVHSRAQKGREWRGLEGGPSSISFHNEENAECPELCHHRVATASNSWSAVCVRGSSRCILLWSRPSTMTHFHFPVWVCTLGGWVSSSLLEWYLLPIYLSVSLEGIYRIPRWLEFVGFTATVSQSITKWLILRCFKLEILYWIYHQ